jgi:hypothetical protein
MDIGCRKCSQLKLLPKLPLPRKDTHFLQEHDLLKFPGESLIWKIWRLKWGSVLAPPLWATNHLELIAATVLTPSGNLKRGIVQRDVSKVTLRLGKDKSLKIQIPRYGMGSLGKSLKVSEMMNAETLIAFLAAILGFLGFSGCLVIVRAEAQGMLESLSGYCDTPEFCISQ